MLWQYLKSIISSSIIRSASAIMSMLGSDRLGSHNIFLCPLTYVLIQSIRPLIYRSSLMLISLGILPNDIVWPFDVFHISFNDALFSMKRL